VAGGAAAEKPVLITGGCGFVGTNLADRVMSSGQPVVIFDNLSRPGVERNLAWLKRTHGDLLQVEAADVQDAFAVRHAVGRASRVFHFAAQVAVTTSLVNAVHDFEVNARGTLNLLEAVRAQDEPPPLVFTSTNKVYGGLPDVTMRQAGQRYEPVDDRSGPAGSTSCGRSTSTARTGAARGRPTSTWSTTPGRSASRRACCG
jgi:CDP-paratose 2-epimerase